MNFVALAVTGGVIVVSVAHLVAHYNTAILTYLLTYKLKCGGRIISRSGLNFVGKQHQFVINPFTADPVKALHFAILV